MRGLETFVVTRVTFSIASHLLDTSSWSWTYLGQPSDSRHFSHFGPQSDKEEQM